MKIPFSIYDFFGYLSTGCLLLIATDFAFDKGWLLKGTPSPVLGIFWAIAAYIIGHIIAHIASVLLEIKFLRGVLGSPEEHLFEERKSTFWARVFPGNYSPFPKPTQERILAKAQKQGVPAPGRNFFFHCHPLVKREQATLERLNSFLNLYGFCRNLSMGLVILVPILLIGAFRNVDWPKFTGLHSHLIAWAILSLVAAIGMFYRYLKFFRHYTVEVFISYAEIPDEGEETH